MCDWCTLSTLRAILQTASATLTRTRKETNPRVAHAARPSAIRLTISQASISRTSQSGHCLPCILRSCGTRLRYSVREYSAADSGGHARPQTPSPTMVVGCNHLAARTARRLTAPRHLAHAPAHAALLAGRRLTPTAAQALSQPRSLSNCSCSAAAAYRLPGSILLRGRNPFPAARQLLGGARWMV